MFIRNRYSFLKWNLAGGTFIRGGGVCLQCIPYVCQLASSTVDSHSIQRVVQPHLEHELVDPEEGQSPEGPDEEGRPGHVDVAPGALGHHPGQGPVQGQQVAPLATKNELVDEENRQSAPTACDLKRYDTLLRSKFDGEVKNLTYN